MLVSFFAGLAAAIIVITIAQTAAAYPSLPARVPMGLNYDGSARGSGPRPMIWLLVVLQLLIAWLMIIDGRAMATNAPGHGTLLGFTIVAVCVNAIFWRVQTLLLSAAKSASNSVEMRGFWIFLAVCLAVVLFAALVLE